MAWRWTRRCTVGLLLVWRLSLGRVLAVALLRISVTHVGCFQDLKNTLGGKISKAVLTAGCSFLYVICANCQGDFLPEGSDEPRTRNVQKNGCAAAPPTVAPLAIEGGIRQDKFMVHLTYLLRELRPSDWSASLPRIWFSATAQPTELTSSVMHGVEQ